MESTSLSPKSTSSEISNGAAAEHARRSLDEARASAEEIAARGSEAIRSGTARAREVLAHTTDQAAHYVQEQPLKSLLMAAAAGAAIALLAGAIGRHHSHH